MGKTTTLLILGVMLLVAVDGGQDDEKVSEAQESWAGWAKEKLSEGIGFKGEETAHDKVTGEGEYKMKDAKVAEKTTYKAKETAEEAKEAAEHKAKEMKEKGYEAADKTEEHLGWAKDKAKEGYEAANTKAGDAVESAKDTIEAAKQRTTNDVVTGGGGVGDEEL